MFFKQRYIFLMVFICLCSFLLGYFKPWQLLQKTEAEIIFLTEKVYTIESTLYIESYVITETEIKDTELYSILYVNNKEEDIINPENFSYNSESKQLVMSYDLSTVEESDFIIMYSYQGKEYPLTTKNEIKFEYMNGVVEVIFDNQLQNTVFKFKRSPEIENYNTIIESVQENKTIRFRQNEYFYDANTNTITLSITTLKNSGVIHVGFLDQHESVLNYYKSNVTWNDEYIKETYIIMLNDNTESVTTFVRVVANESDIKDVVSTIAELPLNQETTKNKL
jgi:hypothetical protein